MFLSNIWEGSSANETKAKNSVYPWENTVFYNNTKCSVGCHLLLNMLDESFWNSIWPILLQFLDTSQKHLLHYLSRKDSGQEKQAEIYPFSESFTPSCHKVLTQVASQLLWYFTEDKCIPQELSQSHQLSV